MQIGEKFTKRGFSGTVLEYNRAAFRGLLDDGQEMWFGAGQQWPVKNMVIMPEVLEPLPTPISLEALSNGKRTRAKLSDPLPFEVDSRFLDYLQTVGVRIRLLYRDLVENEVKNWFEENNLSLPQDIRPVKSQMQSVSGSVHFLNPEDQSFLPPLKYIPRGNQLEVNDVRLVVSLMKLGFPLNEYTRKEQTQ